MSRYNVISLQDREMITDPLTELFQSGARQLILMAVESEFQSFMENDSNLQTESGHAAVVRNGYPPSRDRQTGIGPVTVRI